MSAVSPPSVVTASARGLAGCRECGRVWPAGRRNCGRCGTALGVDPVRSLSRVWAWLTAGILLYIPANLWPMLVTVTFGSREESTIVGGAVELAAHGSYAIAAIVLIASVVVPVAKFAAIALLALEVRRPAIVSRTRLAELYEVVELIGRWSMIDIFVVAILSALVQLGFLASIRPGPAAGCFLLSVAFTMLAARAFDPRLLWLTEDVRR